MKVDSKKYYEMGKYDRENKPEKGEVWLYTDGSCYWKDRIGGWAAILKFCDGKEVHLTDGKENTTSNRMEIYAVLKGLEFIRNQNNYQVESIKLVSDSLYVLETIAYQKYHMNRDLWDRVFELLKGYEIELVFVHGHTGHYYNEKCNELANISRKQLLEKYTLNEEELSYYEKLLMSRFQRKHS